MGASGFFIDKTLDTYDENRFSARSRILIVTAVSTAYGVLAVLIGGYFLGMTAPSLVGFVAVYIYGILGGISVLMLKRVFARAEENRKILFDVLNRDPNAHAVTDKDGNFLYRNQAWKALYGEKETLSYQDVAAAFAKPYQLRQKLQAHFSTQNTQDRKIREKEDFFFVAQTANAQRWLKLIVHPIAGWPSYHQWFVHDVTHEYQAQQMSQEHYEELKALFSDMPAGMAVTDEYGYILNCNKYLEDILGGKSKKAKLHDLFVQAPEEGSAPYSLFKDGRPYQYGLYKIRTASGEIRPLFVSHSILPRKNGELRGYTVFGDPDVFARSGKHLPARDKSDQGDDSYYHGIFDGAPLGMCTVTPDLKIVHFNAAFAELTEQKKSGKTAFSDLVPEQQREALEQWIKQFIAEDEDVQNSHDIEVLQKKNTLPVRLYAHRISGNEILLCTVDLTQQKNLEQQFGQSQKMQAVGQLAGGIAHDFNNLLTAMIGFCDLLLLRHKPGDPSFSDIMQIKQNANRASNLVRQLLAFSRQQTLQPKVLDITDVLSDLSHLLQRLIGATIQMNIKHGQDVWSVKCDAGQLEQVLINLVVNARDAMPEGGRLDIITENYKNTRLERLNEEEYLPPGEWVLIKVKDTGSGIAPDIMRRIFEPFFSTKEIGAGTGLGLSTAHGIIHQTGGYLGVDSEPGKGTIFTIYLPRHQISDKDVADAAEQAADKDGATGKEDEDLTGSAVILLVEDEEAVRTFSSRALSNKGYKIVDAPNGAEALDMVEKGEIELELLITDVIMPEMDGPTLAKHLRRLYPKLKIIFMSGYSEDRFKDEFGKDTHFIQKPFTLQNLAKKVKDVLDSR